LDSKFDEHEGDEYFGEIAADDLQPVNIPDETLDMDFAKNLMYFGNKCLTFNRKNKGNKLFIEGLSKLEKLPTSEEKAKYLLSFAENIDDFRDKKLVYVYINKAQQLLGNTPKKYYVQEEKIQDTIRAISRSLYFLGKKLNNNNLINKSDEISAKIDDSPYKDELGYKSILEYFFNSLEELFMGHSDFWVILTYLSEDGLFFTHEIVQSLVEIARNNFDEEGTVTCLSKLASTLAHGGRWAKGE